MSCDMRDCRQTMKYKAGGGATKQKMKKVVFSHMRLKPSFFSRLAGLMPIVAVGHGQR